MIHESDGKFTISSRHMWLPGVYDTRRAANYAFGFTDEQLQHLQNKVNPGGIITFEMLQQARRIGPE